MTIHDEIVVDLVLEDCIPGEIYLDLHEKRLVRVIEMLIWSPYSKKRVNEHELTIIKNEMEVLAWVSK